MKKLRPSRGLIINLAADANLIQIWNIFSRYLIHSMASYAPLKQSSQLNYFSRIWWWRLFRWFECNVRPGPLPHGFNLPVPLWVWACVRKARYCWTKRNSDSISSGGTAGKKSSHGKNSSRKKLKEVP